MVSRPQVLVVTGMSGAGRSTAAKVLEDLGYLVVDNLPPALIGEIVRFNDLADKRSAALRLLHEELVVAYQRDDLAL